tara:strand:- start:1232 stop:1402 length:171 start_codon:yes stop_codon:yes gene_type:complete
MVDQSEKIYRNSECVICIYEYVGQLKIKKNPLTDENMIICKECFSGLYLKSKKDLK